MSGELGELAAPSWWGGAAFFSCISVLSRRLLNPHLHPLARRSMLTVELKRREGSARSPLPSLDRTLSKALGSPDERTSAPANMSAAAAAEQQAAAPPADAAPTPFGSGFVGGASLTRAGSRSMEGPFSAMASLPRQPSSALPSPPPEPSAAGGGPFAALASIPRQPSSALSSPPVEPAPGGGGAPK